MAFKLHSKATMWGLLLEEPEMIPLLYCWK